MPLVIPNAMKESFLKAIKLGRLEDPNTLLLCGLFVNNVVPTDNSVASDFWQPSYSNYAPQQPIGWSRAYINLAGAAEIDAAPLTWTINDGSLVPFTAYGYFLYDEYQNLLWAELPEGFPVDITDWGQSISLELVLTFGSCVTAMARAEKAPPKPRLAKGIPQGPRALRKRK